MIRIEYVKQLFLNKWENLKLRFTCTPILYVDRHRNFFVFVWQRKDGTQFIQKAGHCEPGEYIKVNPASWRRLKIVYTNEKEL